MRSRPVSTARRCGTGSRARDSRRRPDRPSLRHADRRLPARGSRLAGRRLGPLPAVATRSPVHRARRAVEGGWLVCYSWLGLVWVTARGVRSTCRAENFHGVIRQMHYACLRPLSSRRSCFFFIFFSFRSLFPGTRAGRTTAADRKNDGKIQIKSNWRRPRLHRGGAARRTPRWRARRVTLRAQLGPRPALPRRLHIDATPQECNLAGPWRCFIPRCPEQQHERCARGRAGTPPPAGRPGPHLTSQATDRDRSRPDGRRGDDTCGRAPPPRGHSRERAPAAG